MVTRLLALSSMRFYSRHPAQLLLSIIGIVLGIGIVTAVIITNSSSRRAFELSAQAISGQATHHITGSGTGIDQKHYTHLKRTHNIPMVPVIEGYLSIGDELFTILGIDPFTDGSLSQRTQDISPEAALRLLRDPGALLISMRTHRRSGLPLEQPLEAQIGGSTVKVELVGTYQSSNPAATDGLLIADIATAQEILSRHKTIDRIDVVVNETDESKLIAALPAFLQLSPANARSKTMEDMTHGFHINLTAMSLLALLVGAFLIHNTMTFSILQRRELFATLRITGLTTNSIFFGILGEAAAISLVGSVLGVAVGYLIAKQLIRLTTQTINDLYFVLHVQEIFFNPVHAVTIVALGLLTSLVAASAAAFEAARQSPLKARMRSGLESSTRAMLPLLALAGLILMASGFALSRYPSTSVVIGFIAMMLLISGYGLVIPWIVFLGSRLLRKPLSGAGVVVQLAVSSIHRSISRTGLAIAALTIAVSATFGVDIMIGSFRDSVERWLEQTLQSDIYVSVEGRVSTVADGTLDESLIREIKQLPGVAGIGTTRGITLHSNLGAVGVNVLEPNERSSTGFNFLNAVKTPRRAKNQAGNNKNPSVEPWTGFTEAGHLLISEPLATRHRLAAGDTLELLTDFAGIREFTIAGIYRDYGSSHGRVTISRSVYVKYWNDNTVSALGILTDSSTDILTTITSIRALASNGGHRILIRSNLEIRERSLEVFDQTFRVTRVLRLLTIGVAFIGVFSALLALQLEKAREYAVIRASGATRAQVAGIVITQTVIMGIMAGLLALPLGWIMSDVLISVINVRSFGWTMNALVPSGSIGVTLQLAIMAALIAGFYPAWKLSRSTIADQLRDE